MGVDRVSSVFDNVYGAYMFISHACLDMRLYSALSAANCAEEEIQPGASRSTDQTTVVNMQEGGQCIAWCASI